MLFAPPPAPPSHLQGSLSVWFSAAVLRAWVWFCLHLAKQGLLSFSDLCVGVFPWNLGRFFSTFISLYMCMYIHWFCPMILEVMFIFIPFFLSFSGCSLYCSDFSLLWNPLREFFNSVLFSSRICTWFFCVVPSSLLGFSIHSFRIYFPLLLFDCVFFYLWNACFIMNSRSY